MREILGWLVEQVCRPLDTQVCAVGNIDDDDLGGYYLGT